MLTWFQDHNLPFPVGICDNNPENQGSEIEGIPVISFEEALKQYPNLKILITSVNYGNEIESQVLTKLPKENVVNIQWYFEKVNNQESLFSQSPPEIQAKIKRYTGMLRGENDDNFPLKQPEDIPKEAKEIVKELKFYQDAYLQRKNLLVEKNSLLLKNKNQFHDFWKDNLDKKLNDMDNDVRLVDFLNQSSYNGIYRFGDHLLCSECGPVVYNILEKVENVSKFSKYLEMRGIPFLYVQLPNKLSPEEINLPHGLENNMNQGATAFVHGLEENAVSVLDYRMVMLEEGISFQDSFYKTDNHWNTNAAFHATKRICKELEKRLSLDFDWEKFELENYESRIYQDIFWGDYGKQTGILYSGLDDFQLLLPKYETFYTWGVQENGFCKSGDAEYALLNPIMVDWGYFYLSPYLAYSLKYQGVTKISNHKCKTQNKILVLKDSFARAMASFLAPQFSELYFIDIRGDLTIKDVLQYIDTVKPDVVLMMHWPSAIMRQCVTDLNPNK